MAPAPQPPLSPADPALQVIAMHGWAGDGSHWQPWQEAFSARGWRWQSGERGYGERAPAQPDWQGGDRRVVIAHSMGAHLLNALQPQVLASAEAVVLLASFGRFVPPGSEGRAVRAALDGMGAALADPTSARAMLRRFLSEAAAPDPVEAMAPGPVDGPLTAEGLERLRADLELLGQTDGLPEAFPKNVPVLIVEAGADRIVGPTARGLLREALPAAEVLEMAGAGHALLQAPLLEPVLAWLVRQERP
ncbi:MAG: alpha/beta fold hydrolase [Cyanobacteriota bacterium]|nr:alpha/beta fold hydrolase [Cyanobacteriota bacterium]